MRAGNCPNKCESRQEDGEEEDHCWWKTGESWKKTVVLLPDTGEGRQLSGGAGILDLGPLQVLGGGMLLLLDHRTRIAF